jgi:hypothetical protein
MITPSPIESPAEGLSRLISKLRATLPVNEEWSELDGDVERALKILEFAPSMLAILKRLNTEIGEGSERGRAIDLLPARTVNDLRDAIARAKAAGIG